jgi:hypothetical protein
MERARLSAPIADRRRDVVLEILSHAPERNPDRNAVGAELLGIADPGQHQQLRRVDRAAGENDLAIRARDPGLAAPDVFDADGAMSLEHHPGSERSHLDREVGPLQRGTKIRGRRAASPAVADGHLDRREALLLRTVVVVGHGMAGRHPRGHVSVAQRIGEARLLRGQGAVAAAIGVGAALPRFLAAEVGQHVGVSPLRQAGRGPAIVIVAVPVIVGHGVDRGRAADDLAARAFDAPAVEVGGGLGEVHPVVQALLQDAAPAERNVDPRIAVPSAGLEHEHLGVRLLGEAIGQGAAGGAGAHDDIVPTFRRRHARSDATENSHVLR